ncbi:MAG: alpha/beta hydrolase [Gaiellaceae bacterium]
MRELAVTERTSARVFDGAAERGAVFLPGRAIGCEWGPMRLTSLHLHALGWTTMLLSWRPERRPEWVQEQAVAALELLGAERALLVGKSLGTFAAAVAADRRLPAIWFTPLLNEQPVVEALERSEAPTLLVGGTHDEAYDPQLVERLPVESLTVVGADHSLEFADAYETLELQRRILNRVDAFVRDLD